MQVKLFCPNCGRCLGECNASEEATCKVLIAKPNRIGKMNFINNIKFVKFKNEVFILLEFKD